MTDYVPPTGGVTTPPHSELSRVTAVVAKVMREHRYYLREGLGDAECECGVIAPLTVCNWDVRHHIAERIASELEAGA